MTSLISWHCRLLIISAYMVCRSWRKSFTFSQQPLVQWSAWWTFSFPDLFHDFLSVARKYLVYPLLCPSVAARSQRCTFNSTVVLKVLCFGYFRDIAICSGQVLHQIAAACSANDGPAACVRIQWFKNSSCVRLAPPVESYYVNFINWMATNWGSCQ